MKICKYFLIFILFFSCKDSGIAPGKEEAGYEIIIPKTDTQKLIINPSQTNFEDTINKVADEKLNAPAVSRHELVNYAKTLIGTPYLYASTDPSKGFDCSGFITYVFNHFQWHVPRSSVDFTNYGKEINILNAREGDLILFTGTNDSIRIVGHMGIITENKDTLKFIHSTSGHAYGVTISDFGDRYKKRFVKVIDIFDK